MNFFGLGFNIFSRIFPEMNGSVWIEVQHSSVLGSSKSDQLTLWTAVQFEKCN